jgi:hypothetical protein
MGRAPGGPVPPAARSARCHPIASASHPQGRPRRARARGGPPAARPRRPSRRVRDTTFGRRHWSERRLPSWCRGSCRLSGRPGPRERTPPPGPRPAAACRYLDPRWIRRRRTGRHPRRSARSGLRREQPETDPRDRRRRPEPSSAPAPSPAANRLQARDPRGPHTATAPRPSASAGRPRPSR